jgi:hypothetical protein
MFCTGLIVIANINFSFKLWQVFLTCPKLVTCLSHQVFFYVSNIYISFIIQDPILPAYLQTFSKKALLSNISFINFPQENLKVPYLQKHAKPCNKSNYQKQDGVQDDIILHFLCICIFQYLTEDTIHQTV